MATAKKVPGKVPAKKGAAKKAAGKKAAAKRAGPPSAGAPMPGGMDAIKLLTSDHREVKALFQQYQALVDHDAEDDEKQPIAEMICKLLTVHAQIEEEIFYPAAKDSIQEDDLVDEATVEHASAKELIAQIEAADPSDELYDAKVKVLGEYIDHHVKEEESEMFPQARKARLDIAGLGEALMQRKLALMAELGIGDDAEAADEETEDETAA